MSYNWELRPWGSWHILDEGDGYKVKRIHVSPKSRLSLQSHVHRAEHWIVISGVAKAVVDDEIVEAGPGGTIDIPLGAKHRLINDGDDEVVIIEIQKGDYTGEDDIVRYEDDYGRTG